MNGRWQWILLAGIAWQGIEWHNCGRGAEAERKPNFILILADNLGNGDLGVCGSKLHRTPHIDRMAAEGLRLTSFYVASGVCSPSRAAFLTGCYPRRNNMHENGSGGAVLRPLDTRGLHPSESTFADVLKKAGYATACIGKWHQGDQPPFLPTRQGFDVYFGIPYSDDMAPTPRNPGFPPLPLMRGEKVIEAPVNRDLLTKRYTAEAVRFIEANRDRPFCLYLPHAMPGSTSRPYSSPEFQGRSANGPYGDAVEELDWSTGQILEALQRLKLDEHTLVIWTSDNGAVKRQPLQGSCLPYRGFGYDTSEGAMRMPCIVRWPGKIAPGGVSDELCSSLDLLPTFVRLGGGKLPEGRIIDGRDIWPLLARESNAKSPYDERGFFYYRMEQLQAVRAGAWKLYLPLENKFVNLARKGEATSLELYDVRNDPSEKQEVSAQHPEIVKRLLVLADNAREDLGDVDRPGKNQRPAGHVAEPQPQVKK